MRVITIGRERGSNDIVVNDPKVSRNHLQLIVDDNGNVTVADMGSTNGTFVNGIRIVGESALCANDQLRVGDSVLPWQSYITAPTLDPPAYIPPFQQSPYQDPAMNSPRSHSGLIIALSITGALLLGVVVWLLLTPRQGKLHPSQAHYSHRESSDNLLNNDSATTWDSKRAREEYTSKWLRMFENNTNRPARRVDKDKEGKEAEAVKLREEGYSNEDIEKILAGEPKSKFKTKQQIEEEKRKAEEKRIKDSIDNANRTPTPKPHEKSDDEKKQETIKKIIEDNKPKIDSRVDL